MKALVKKEKTQGVWLQDVPVPKISDDEVLIKTKKAAICGTDVNIYKWGPWAQKNVPVPLVIGHEYVGEIVELGRNVKGLKVGERVCGEGHITCGQCRGCREGKRHLCSKCRGLGYHINGCFADYFKLPAENVFKLPEFVSDEVAAIFDPYGNAMHTALSFNLSGEDVLITGAGPIGLMAVGIAKHAGARTVVITDHNPYRLQLAEKMGATRAVNITDTKLTDVMKELKINEGFSVGLEMSGNVTALSTMLETALFGANIALLGILPPGSAIDWDLVIFKMLNLKGIYGREIFGTFHKMVSFLESGLDLTPLITHRFEVEDFEKGFQAMLSGQSGKVILNWS